MIPQGPRPSVVLAAAVGLTAFVIVLVLALRDLT